MEEKEIKIQIAAHTEKYAEDDNRWIDQKHEFVDELKREALQVDKQVKMVDGKKGGIETIVLTALPALIPAISEIVKSFLSRDNSRQVTITKQVDGKPVSTTIDAKGLDKKTFEELVANALK